MDKVKNFCDHSMILWEMAANPKPTGHFWTPPPPLGLIQQVIERKNFESPLINLNHCEVYIFFVITIDVQRRMYPLIGLFHILQILLIHVFLLKENMCLYILLFYTLFVCKPKKHAIPVIHCFTKVFSNVQFLVYFSL